MSKLLSTLWDVDVVVTIGWLVGRALKSQDEGA